MLKEARAAGMAAAFEKIAGGPGSGVKGYNTATIPAYPRSKYISVGTRKSMLDNMDFKNEHIAVKDITHVAQDKFVPDKLQKFLKDPKLVTKSPIDILRVGDNHVAVVDGHHRALSAMALGITSLPARVFTRRK